MQVSVTFRHMNPTDALKEFAADKVGRMEKFIHLPTDAHVVLSVEKYLHKAEINIVANGVRMRGEETSDDMYGSIDGAASKIERQVKRYLDKLTSHKPREGHAQKVKLNVLEAAREPEHDEPNPETEPRLPNRIIETRELDAKPMSRKEGTFGLLEAPGR